MIKAVCGLLLRAFVVLSGATILTFALLWNAPGDPAQAIAMARFDALLTDEVVDQVRQEVGLDRSFWQAFWAWLGPLLTLDLGFSAVTGRPVWPDLAAAISYTFPLAFSSLAVGLAVSVPLALLATKRPGGWMDRLAVAAASLGNAIPAYWLGLILILLFSVKLAWLPALGASTPAHAILPALTLGLGVAASLTRIIRSGILEARGQPFLPAFRRRGIVEKSIGRDHVAPHAAIPVVTVLGLELAFLLEGLVLVEVIFGRPGLGTFLVQAILARDFAHVQAVVVLTALVFVAVNLAIDLTYRIVDPRIGESDA
ncbi:peptide/nickel transport system permease protein [Ruegeria intermedia]|uniref:Peptide/nickel transport system permease protein n=1 Tax=Ruegeria intermedia TaxID=996115 RepID=A0A1M5BM56_9RHOB|nr:ABC transporter permease [Ruegeria intermedia]SHF43579.1 peptide/nickel transport system permease protein [Ruegeria intermedia]